MRARALAVASVAATLACGNRAAEVQQQIRDLCVGLVPGQSTLRDASVAFSAPVSSGQAAVLTPSCRTDRRSTGADDRCRYDGTTQVCIVRYEFVTTDCSGQFSGGTCASYCDLRTESAPQSSAAVICGREFIPNQAILAAPEEAPPR